MKIKLLHVSYSTRRYNVHCKTTLLITSNKLISNLLRYVFPNIPTSSAISPLHISHNIALQQYKDLLGISECPSLFGEIKKFNGRARSIFSGKAQGKARTVVMFILVFKSANFRCQKAANNVEKGMQDNEYCQWTTEAI